MHKFDRHLRDMAKTEKREIPECVKMSVEEALNTLPDAKPKKPALKVLSRALSMAACVAVLVLFVLPNVSPAYATSMEKVPVIGKLVKVITIRNYFYTDDRHDLDVEVPKIDEENEAANWINKDVGELTQILVNQFYKDLDVNGNNGYGSIHLDYETVTDSETWFTLKLSVTEIAASSNQYYKYYHIDKQNGKIVRLGDLFADEQYSALLEAEIKTQMQNRMAKNPAVVYWTEESEFGEDFVSIHGDHNFYWDKKGDLVITFDKYEVGPGSTGTPEFTIPKEVYISHLKAEYQNQNV